MKIDILGKPPVDIFRHRGRDLRLSLLFLALAACGGLLMVYGIVSDAPSSESLETVALTLLAGSAMLFGYFGKRLNEYKRLNVGQSRELVSLGQKYAEIATYCALVAAHGREVVFGEFEACKEWAENQEQAQ